MIDCTIKKISLLIFLLITLSACNGELKYNHFIASPPIPKDATRIDSKGRNYRIFFSPSKEKMPLNRYFDLDIQVRGITNQLVKFPLVLKVDAGMRAHNHGMNVKPIVEDLGNGYYKVKGMLFHMAGEWFLNFSLYRGVLADKAEIPLFITR